MRILKKILPVLVIVLVTMIAYFFLYNKVVEYEREQCWQELQTTAQTVQKEITVKFQDEIAKLHLIREILLNNRWFQSENMEELCSDLNAAQVNTIFSRIDIWYQDDTLVSDGEISIIEETYDFDSVASAGERLSNRKTDPISEDQYVYYILPMVQANETVALLIAGLDIEYLSEIFQPLIYNGEASVCIVDADDGSYILDSWHSTLGKVDLEDERNILSEYSDINAEVALLNMETGAAAFRSQTNDQTLYLYFTPIGMFDWQLYIFAQEDVLFANIFQLKKIFISASMIEVILIALYFGIHFRNVKQLEKSYQCIQQQKEELTRLSYIDMLTSLYNRNKFMEKIAELNKDLPIQLGIAYIDLNGLKQINDLNSHEAGDEYLRLAGKTITEVFSDCVYRVGGDEFVILSPHIEKGIFEEKIAVLQNAFEAAQISGSIGICWERKCQDIDMMLKLAEQQMYHQKRIFYKNSREHL